MIVHSIVLCKRTVFHCILYVSDVRPPVRLLMETHYFLLLFTASELRAYSSCQCARGQTIQTPHSLVCLSGPSEKERGLNEFASLDPLENGTATLKRARGGKWVSLGLIAPSIADLIARES